MEEEAQVSESDQNTVEDVLNDQTDSLTKNGNG